MITLQHQIPNKLIPLFTQYDQYRYFVLKGGRSSGKSWTIAYRILLAAVQNPIRILCTRQYHNSIETSVYALFKELIHREYLCADGEYRRIFADKFIIKSESILCKNGSVFIFKGLDGKNIESIRSTEGINICWIEEAEYLSETSYQILLPTLFRRSNPKIFLSFNPDSEKSATYQRFVAKQPPNSIVIHINYTDNPFCTVEEIELAEEDRLYRPEIYRHVWEGDPKTLSEAVVFKDKFSKADFGINFLQNIEVFHDKRIKWFCGIDFGFSVDPFAAIAMFIHEDCLYIWDEIYLHQLEIDDMVPVLNKKFNYILSKNVRIYADNARPEIIAQLASVRRHKNGDFIQALNIEESPKGKDSVETGLDYLKNFKHIFIHERCINTLYEFENYSYKQDKKTGEILPLLVDKDNHAIDAIRYGLCQLISNPRRNLTISSQFVENMQRFVV